MKIAELMAGAPVLSVDAEDDLALASQTMLWAGLRHVPVTRSGRVVGVLSESDVLRYQLRVGPREGAMHPVKSAMSEPAITVSPDTDVADAAAQLIERDVTCLPVVDHNRLVGMVTSTDLLGVEARRQWTPPITGQASATDVMTPNPDVAHPDDDLLDAAARMNQVGARHLPVVDGENRVVGILSDRDVRTAVGDLSRTIEEVQHVTARVQQLKVMHAMTSPARTVRADESVQAVGRHFLDWRVGALPVVDDAGHLQGIISYLDLLDTVFAPGLGAAAPGTEPAPAP